MTSLLRKVALAPDRDDFDDPEAKNADPERDSPLGPGDSERDHDDTEGTVAEGSDPVSDGLTTEGAEVPPLPEQSLDTGSEPETVATETVATETVATETVAVESDGEHGQPVGFEERPVPGDDSAPSDETVDHSEDATPPPPSSSSASTVAPPRRTKTVVVLTVLSLVVVGAGVGGLIWSRRSSGRTANPPTAQPTSPSPTLSDGAFVTYTDAETGFSMRYPRGWTRSEAPVREVRLIVSDGKRYSASVRVIHTQDVTTPANLANIKAVTDGVVGPGVQILKQDPITVNGLIGFRYIYTFTDKDSGLTTAHLHYFLFQGHKMNSIVFEAVPSEGFDRIQGTFDQMLGSFHSDPEPP